MGKSRSTTGKLLAILLVLSLTLGIQMGAIAEVQNIVFYGRDFRRAGRCAQQQQRQTALHRYENGEGQGRFLHGERCDVARYGSQ